MASSSSSSSSSSRSSSATSLSIKDSSQVRVLDVSEYKQAALALAEAFEHDEVARYFIDVPDRPSWSEKQRWDLHLAVMEYITYAHTMGGLVTTVGEDYGGVALWLRPGDTIDGTWTLVRSGMWRLMYKLSAEGRRRMFKEFFPLLHDTKEEVLGPEMDPNSWYLVYLGTRPSGRGKGYARKLIEHGISEASKNECPVYLESSNKVNVKYYRKFGFEVDRTIALARAEKPVELDIMVLDTKARMAAGTVEGAAVAHPAVCEKKPQQHASGIAPVTLHVIPTNGTTQQTDLHSEKAPNLVKCTVFGNGTERDTTTVAA